MADYQEYIQEFSFLVDKKPYVAKQTITETVKRYAAERDLSVEGVVQGMLGCIEGFKNTLTLATVKSYLMSI